MKADCSQGSSPRSSSSPPAVLAASGLDPTGSAGLLADVRVLSALGCHPCGVVTCQTVQSSRGLTGIRATDPDLLREQLHAVLEDIPLRGVKIGAVASPDTIEVLSRALERIPDVPVVLDPVFQPTLGPAFLDADGMKAMAAELLPKTLVATPNLRELGAPAGIEVDEQDDEMALGCVHGWFGTGLNAVLVTGLKREGEMVDRLYRLGPGNAIDVTDFAHPRHAVGEVHGSGCVLASALAAYIAHGAELVEACEKASAFTARMIEHAHKFGGGAAFWMDVQRS